MRASLRHGPKAGVGCTQWTLCVNRGFARFLILDKGAVAIDAAAIEADARFEGIFVLRTNTDVPADEVARLYKGLWRVERAFREVKSTLEIRPIYHQSDEACVGHLVAGFLALRLEVDLQRRLDAAGVTTPWTDLMRELAQVHAVVVDLNGQRDRLRTDLAGAAHAAAGLRPPNSVTRLGPFLPPTLRIRSAKDQSAAGNILISNDASKHTVQDQSDLRPPKADVRPLRAVMRESNNVLLPLRERQPPRRLALAAALSALAQKTTFLASETPCGEIYGLARISHQGRCIGLVKLRKLFWRNDLLDSTARFDADTVYL